MASVFSKIRGLIGHAGYVTLEALAWLRAIGAALVQIGRDGGVLAHSVPYGYDGHPIRRAQALAVTRLRPGDRARADRRKARRPAANSRSARCRSARVRQAASLTRIGRFDRARARDRAVRAEPPTPNRKRGNFSCY